MYTHTHTHIYIYMHRKRNINIAQAKLYYTDQKARLLIPALPRWSQATRPAYNGGDEASMNRITLPCDSYLFLNASYRILWARSGEACLRPSFEGRAHTHNRLSPSPHGTHTVAQEYSSKQRQKRKKSDAFFFFLRHLGYKPITLRLAFARFSDDETRRSGGRPPRPVKAPAFEPQTPHFRFEESRA
jgi:hypothetical protein